MLNEVAVNAADSNPQLAVKDAILARSGIYVYSLDDVRRMGINPPKVKPYYHEYRPAGVLIKAKDMFALVPVTKDHPPVDIDAGNFHQYASGVTGGPIEVITLPDGEVGLKGRMAFFTRDAFDYYMEGNNQTSAGYDKKLVYVEDSEKAGYDWVMTEIVKVNHEAVLPRGRGGSDVRVLDRAAAQGAGSGGSEMAGEVKKKGGFLEFLGIRKPKDDNFKFSDVLLESVAKVHSLDQAGLEKEIGGVMTHVNALGDSEPKEFLVGAVTDCFKNPVEVVAQKDIVAKKIDELYMKCRDADAEAVRRILDADSKGDDKKDAKNADDKDGDKKDAKDAKDAKDVSSKDKAPDLSVVIDAAVQKAVVTALDGLDAKVDNSVKKALGIDDAKDKKKEGDDRTVDANAVDGAGSEDASFLVRGIFGNQ